MTIINEYLHYYEKYYKKYGDKTIVLMQIGTFHEAYSTETRGYNLEELAKILNITFTRKNKNIDKIDESNPYLVGVPTIALQRYLTILIDNQYTVIIVDQITSPPNPQRAVTGIYSPGTYIDDIQTVDSNNMVCIYINDELQRDGSILMCIGMSVVDLTTGKNSVYEAYSTVNDDKYALDEALRFLNSYNPKEIIIARKEINTTKYKVLENKDIIIYLELESKLYKYINKIEKHYYKISYLNEFLKIIYSDTGMLSPIEYIDMEMKPYALISFVILLDFAYQHNEKIVNHLDKPEIFQNKKHLILGNNAVNQLNVIDNEIAINTRNIKFRSLFDVVNNTSTAMGRRYLKSILIVPIISKKELNLRYDCIEELLKNDKYKQIENNLKCIIDLERLIRKLSLKMLNPYDFNNIYDSCYELLKIIDIIKENKILSNILPEKDKIDKLNIFLKDYEETFKIDEMKKYGLKNIQTSIFVEGLYPNIDNKQNMMLNYVDFMNNVCKILSKYVYDKKLKNTKNTDIKMSLKKNNRDGYYLSLTKLRAESLKNNIKNINKIKISDNFSIDPKKLKFKELEKGNTKIFLTEIAKKFNRLDETQLQSELEKEIYECYISSLDKFFNKYFDVLKINANFIAKIDFIKSSAKTAKLYNYIKPEIISGLNNGCIKCKELRHPIIERIKLDSPYIPHDISLGKDVDDQNKEDILEGLLIYGTNSCGKSSLMKAIGLSIIMAQCGMYVPARKYRYAPYNALYARITGNDNIFKGMSSFVLEMTELKAILKRAGPKTIVIGDEICRGTEYISGNTIVAASLINLAKTHSTFIFASHLHYIAKMNRIKELKNVKSYHLTVDYDKPNDLLIFDRKLKDGPGESIYGINIARYIISDNKFTKLLQEIKNELIGESNNIIPNKTSRYNSKVYLKNCAICKKKLKIHGEMNEFFDTHHINFQKNCENGFVKDKPHIQMNSQANLIILCKKCHNDVHQNKIIIKGYIDTSKGKKVNYKKKNHNAI